MLEQSLLLKLSTPGLADDATSRYRQEYQASRELFQAQSALVQQFLRAQAAALAEAAVQNFSHAHFSLPDAVACFPSQDGSLEIESIPQGSRDQILGSRMHRLAHTDFRSALCQRFNELEHSPNRAVSLGTGLLRFATALHMVYNMLPAGKSVVYQSVSDDIPNQPVEQDTPSLSARTFSTEAQTVLDQAEMKSGEFQVPYVEAARRFYLPQWIAFDDQGDLLMNSISEAEAHIASMQQYLSVLNSAIVIAPYMIVDEVCQQKRYGMLGQLVNQGRALARYQAKAIIQTIKRRVAEHRLDRGLSISLPYFDDQKLRLESYDFIVIPAGRVMFIPAFVVLAARAQGAKAAQDTHLSQSTRRYLLMELSMLEESFRR